MIVTKEFSHHTSAFRSRAGLTLTIIAALLAGSIFAEAQATTSSAVSVARATHLDSGDAVIGTLPMNQPIHIEVALKLRNKNDLDAFIANIAKRQALRLPPKLMTSDLFLANHAPTMAQAQMVADYLARMGYTHIVIAPNRLLVSADGTAATARNAFMTTLAQVRTHDGRIAFANTNEVHVPTTLANTVLAVVGLQNVDQFNSFAQTLSSVSTQTGSVSTQYPTDFPWIYGATTNVTNQVPVGILTDGNLTDVQKALNNFASIHSMQPIAQSVVNTNGTSTDATHVTQWALDSQAIVGMINGGPGANAAPAASVIFYNIPSLSNADVTADFNTIVAANQTKIIEASVTQCETAAQSDGTAAAQDAILETAMAQGQTFSVPAGNLSSDECHNHTNTPSWPASSQYVTAVAGTTLNTTTSFTGEPKYNFETVWVNTGGSPSTFEPMPSWQASFGVSGTTRGVPDVAFAANQGAYFVTNNGGQGMMGGTTLSAALFAGTWARILSVWGIGSGPASPILYALPASDFHDITSGNNFGETAGPGYDFTSGRGSMITASAIADAGPLVNKPPTASFKISQPGPLTLHFKDLSTDSDGTIVAHHWDFGDGATSTGTFPNHTYAASGTYTIVETVTDNDGATDQDTQTASTFKQVVVNPSFETGTFSPWNFSATGTGHGLVTLDGTSADAFDGTWSADITYGGGTYLYQTVTIPSGTTSATLTVHLWVQDNEPPFHSNDLNIQLRQPGGGGISQDTVLTTLGTFTNLDASSGYVTHTFDVTPYIGQKVIVTFQGVKHPDGNPVSGQFAIDDVTLTAQ